jgi:hypothetical protein
MFTKPLWQSKTFWSDVLTLAISIFGLLDHYAGTHIMNSPFWPHALAFAAAAGIYGRSTADTKISGLL